MKIKIKSIYVYLVNLKLRFPFTTSFGTYLDVPRPFVKLVSDQNLIGYGEIPTLPDPAYKAESDTESVLTSLEKFIIPAIFKYQKNNKFYSTVSDLRESYSWIKGANFAKAGVEFALWDIISQIKKTPLTKLWGGMRKSFTVGVSIGGRTEDEVVNRAEEAVGKGYKRLKIKIWPGFEFKVMKALRKEFPNTLMQVDGNSAYTLENWKLLKKLDQFNLLLIEQPLYSEDIVFHSEISKSLKTPICLDESIHSQEDAKGAIYLWKRNKNLKRLIINIKPARVSGFAESLKIVQLCSKNGIKTWIGGMLESGWGKGFNLSFNSLSGINLPGDHFSPTGPYFEEDITTDLPISKNGEFKLGKNYPHDFRIDQKKFNKLAKKLIEIKG